eukprot:5412314-Prymnesium_polylepis.1
MAKCSCPERSCSTIARVPRKRALSVTPMPLDDACAAATICSEMCRVIMVLLLAEVPAEASGRRTSRMRESNAISGRAVPERM